RGSPAHAPALQRSALVQGSPSSQLAPSSGSYTHSPSTQAPMAVKQRPGGLSQASGAPAHAPLTQRSSTAHGSPSSQALPSTQPASPGAPSPASGPYDASAAASGPPGVTWPS